MEQTEEKNKPSELPNEHIKAEESEKRSLSQQEKQSPSSPALDKPQCNVTLEATTVEDVEDEGDRDNSTKLIIDLDDEKAMSVEEEKELKNDITERDELLKNEDIAIIALSDGEEDEISAPESIPKAAKVQKRRSVGATGQLSNDEEPYRLKRRKINVAGAPKMPLTGYVRYMNERRDSLRKEHPNKTAIEHTKMIGEEWQTMSADLKGPYMRAAELDKQRYVKELHTFLKSRPDVLASELAKNKPRKSVDGSFAPSTTNNTTTATTKVLTKEKVQCQNTDTKSVANKELQKDKVIKGPVSPSTPPIQLHSNVAEKIKSKRTPTPPLTTQLPTDILHNANNAGSTTTITTTTIVTATPGEISIFTNEFLEHNKIYDTELKALRKSRTDLEQQNAMLEKYVENMKSGVHKMINENNELQEKNRLLEIYLDKLKRKLAQALSALPLPMAPQGATVENIEKYMQDLYKMATTNSHGPATLNKAKDIIRKLDLQIQL
uniref:HMG box domain-containing protein n=1 Tax=Glossina brevipalpis TaxID=37001 RepID=A0A1A9WSZ7_9MUSC